MNSSRFSAVPCSPEIEEAQPVFAGSVPGLPQSLRRISRPVYEKAPVSFRKRGLCFCRRVLFT